MRRVLWVLVSVAGSCLAAAVGEGDVPAPIARNLEGLRGICLDLHCGDGTLAAAIAQEGELYVFALAKDEKNCAAARATLDQAGLYGKRATVVVGSSKAIPLPNGYCNLITTGEFSDDIDLKEVVRVLNPNGLAVLGGPRVRPAELKDLAKRAGVADPTVIEKDGTWLVVKGQMPATADDWTHMHHGPGNNPVSSDASIRPPFRTQWIASPMGWMVAARGRLLIKTDRILVQDGLNGTLLWKRKSPDAVRVNDTLMVGDRVFAIEKNRIVALDAGTGNQIGVFGLPSTYEVSRLHRMAFQDNTLYVPVDQKGLPHKKYDPWLADLLVALDAGDGRLLWAYKAERPFYENSLVLGPQAAYLCSPESGAIGVDLKTGALLWRNPDIKEGVDFRGQYVTIYHDGGVLYLGSQNLAFLDAKTGANRYSIPTPHAKVAFIGNTLYATGGYGSPINSYDILTGEKQPKSLPPSGSWNGCRRMGATSSCLVQQNTFVDLETGQKFYIDMSRTQCGQGVNFANGLAYLSSDPTYCSCDYPMKGMIVMAPAGGWKVPDTQRDLTQCLKKGSAFDSPLTVHADQDDWPSYRHDSCRSACAGGAVKLPSDKGWQKKLSGNLTPISAAGELVFTASSDGHVWALDAGGVVKWTYLCGSGITVTPAYWKGRLFVGSNDGWVYCLDARTGQLAWRFHAAPEDRYVAVDGRLGSTWPVIGGVVVDDDTVYFAAGMCSYDGVYLYAMDAANGRLGWVKEIGHLSETPQNAVCVGANPYGALAIGDDLLYVPTGGSRPIAFNKKDGDLIWWQGNLGGADFDGRTGGAEIVVSGDMLTNGGQRLVGPAYGFRLYHASSGHYYAVCPEATKPGPLPKDTKQLNPFKGDFLGLGTTSPVLTPAVCYTIKREYRQPDKLVAYRRDNLKDVNMAMGADKAKAEAGGILWSTKNVPAGAHSIVVAGSQILVAGTSEVVVLDETGQKELARFKVESKILPNGLAVAKGKAYVVTEEGSAFCLGRALLEP